jgi:hypothetical protein
MSPMDQAALWIHEALYKVLRDDDGDQDSRRTRLAVARAFGLAGLPQLPTPSFSCFQGIDTNFKTYSFSLMLSTENQQFRGWIMRIDNKWLLPSLLAVPRKPEDEKDFLKYMELKQKPASLSSIPEILNLSLEYKNQDQDKNLVAVLSQKVSPGSSPLYDFTLFVSPGVKANCISGWTP